MNQFEDYYEYLLTRSMLGSLYRRLYVYPRLRQFIQYPAVDVGCGIGDFLRFDQKILGLDINPKLVAYVTSKGMGAKHMPVDELPLESNSINFVNLDNVLEHISNPEPLLTEIARVLTDGGGFLVGVPGIQGYASDPDHKIFYDEALLTQTVQKIGFEHRKTFHTPFRMKLLDRHMRQYCMYCYFKKCS